MFNAYKIRNIIESFSGSTPFQIKLSQPIKPHYSDQHPNSPKQVLRSVMVHFWPVKMLQTSKPLIGIHKVAERDGLICILRIYNCK